MVDLKRRHFEMLLAAALAASPLRGQAHQTKVVRIGVLILGNADAESFRIEMTEELRKAGYLEGQNVHLEFRSADGKLDLLPRLAANLVSLDVDVIVALFTPCALAAQQATRRIPIVFIVADPVETGLVASLAHPGGNITGVSLRGAESHGKCVELFRDMLSSIRRVAFLGNAADPSWKHILAQVQDAGKVTEAQIAPVKVVGGMPEIDAAFAAMKAEEADAVVVQGSFSTKAVADLAIKHRLAAATVPRSFAEVGGLMAYGAGGPESFRRCASFVIRILRGAKPDEMPVEQPTKFDLVVNLRTAKLLGLKISETFLLRADTVIE